MTIQEMIANNNIDETWRKSVVVNKTKYTLVKVGPNAYAERMEDSEEEKPEFHINGLMSFETLMVGWDFALNDKAMSARARSKHYHKIVFK